MHLLIAAITGWFFLYAVVVSEWREALILLLLFLANMFLAGSEKR